MYVSNRGHNYNVGCVVMLGFWIVKKTKERQAEQHAWADERKKKKPSQAKQEQARDENVLRRGKQRKSLLNSCIISHLNIYFKYIVRGTI